MNKPIEVDGSNLIYHPERVAEWKAKGDCFPIYVEIGPTNRCNHRCVFCALDWVGKGGTDLDSGVMESALEDMANNGVKSVMFAGEGEPVLHKDICKFIGKAGRAGLTVTMTMNGSTFTRDKAEECLPHMRWARFSIDAGSKETYAKIHKTSEADFPRVIENIRASAEIRDARKLSVSVSAQYLLIPENVDEVLTLAKTVMDAGADNFQVKPYSQHPSSENRFVINYKAYAHLGPELEKLNSDTFQVLFRERAMQRLESKPPYTCCLGLPFFALINSKGDVIPCNLFYNNPNFAYGNLNKNSFSEIWRSEKRKDVIRRMNQAGVENCREVCRLDATNRYLFKLTNPDPVLNLL